MASPSCNSSDHPEGFTRYRAPVLWMLVVLGWVLLYCDTFDIRHANLDDLNFHRKIVGGTWGKYTAEWGPAQGRYYGAFIFAPIYALEVINPPWLFQLLRLGLVAAPLWLIGRLATKVTRSPEAEQLWWLLWIGLLQIPPTFYALLSYPQMNCGLILVLLAGHSFWHTLERNATSPGLPWRAGLWFFAGLQFHEAFLSFVMLFVACWLWRTPAALRRPSAVVLLPIASAAILYAGIYFGYYFQHQPSYEGTQGGTDLAGMIVYLVRYSASSLPGFELMIDRNVTHPAFVPWEEAARRIATFDPLRLPWVLAVGGMAAWSIGISRWTLPWRRSVQLIAGSAVLGLLFLVPAGVSQKYQVFAYQRLYPHAYNLVTVHFGWLAVAIACLGLAGALPPDSWQKRTLATSLGVACAAICLVCQATNQLALAQIRQIIAQAP